MSFVELVLIAVGLSADAFAVSLCKGLSMQKFNMRNAVVIAAFFGGFQALMPLIGWFLGSQFEQYITEIDHWIAFVLLLFIGGKMIFEVIRGENCEKCEDYTDRLDVKELLILAVATSIDALAVGITLAFLKTSIAAAASLIGIITFLLSLIGVAIGNKFGSQFKRKAELAGGIVLVLIGVKILLQHLEVIDF